MRCNITKLVTQSRTEEWRWHMNYTTSASSTHPGWSRMELSWWGGKARKAFVKEEEFSIFLLKNSISGKSMIYKWQNLPKKILKHESKLLYEGFPKGDDGFKSMATAEIVYNLESLNKDDDGLVWDMKYPIEWERWLYYNYSLHLWILDPRVLLMTETRFYSLEARSKLTEGINSLNINIYFITITSHYKHTMY